jgi:signal transduction histidine kinase
MANQAQLDNPEFRQAFLANERDERINTGRVAAALVVVLMPIGVLLDFFVYPDRVGYFFGLRLLCAALAIGIWHLHATRFGQKYYRLLGLPIALLPALFISWMIVVTEGPASPYYAGLNLILLSVSVVVHWSLGESLVAAGSVLLMYVGACLLRRQEATFGIIFNNGYFLALTGLIVVTGNFFFNRLRYREFALRFELDKNRQALEESNRKLTELDQAKSRFFANISHELRTPLTLLLAPLETLLNRFKSTFDQDTRNLLVTMHSNGMRLLKLINDLLDLVRLESGHMVVRQDNVSMNEFIRGLASATRQVAQDKRIRLETSVDPELGSVVLDRDKLEKIVLNLVFNALKFTPAGGRVELKAVRQGEQVVITVRDTGMGISQKNLAHMFERFWQADDSSRRKYQGMGIGLALVKELAEVQGGTVKVESEEGKGTTFTIHLPYRRAEEQPASVSEASSEQVAVSGEPTTTVATPAAATSDEWLSSLYRRAELFPALTPVQESLKAVETAANRNLPKLLVADDEPDMLRFLKSQLVSRYQVLEAVDGQQAIEKAAQFLPDVILLDMMMPEKDGLQACKELRERTTTQNIPIILLTARADEQTKLAALNAGASDFLAKPFSTTELHVRIKNLVDSYNYQRKLSKQNLLLEQTIENLKETEMQLVQSEKLNSLGRMSAGLIHEINNPLNFATTGLYTLRNKARLLSPGQQADYLEIVKDLEDGISRVKTIVSDLRSFSHHENEQVEEVSARDLIELSLRFASHEWKEKVRIEQNIPLDQTILGNKNRLSLVCVNLVQNALDALKNKSFPEGESPLIRIEGEYNDRTSTIRFRDNGTGIDPEHLDKIFDPFFTTKDVGQGMGLGLSICYRIVQEYDGKILVSSERGKYCQFSLEFPAQAPAVPAAAVA